MSDLQTPPKTPYLWLAGALLCAAALAVLPLVGSAFGIAALDWLDPVLIGPAFNDIVFVSSTFGALLALAVWLYAAFLSLRRHRRPRAAVFLNALAPALFAAVEIVCFDYSSNVRDFTLVSRVVAPLVALGFPLFVLLAESLVFRFCLGIGRGAGEHDWRVMALPLLRVCLRLRPERRDLRALAGRIYARNDDFENAVAMLSMLGSPADIEDEPTLRAMESSFRGAGLLPLTIESLKALARRHPADETLSRKIIDDLIHLDRHAEALQFIENARLPVDIPLLKLRQELNVKIGRLEPAAELTAQIAAREPAPRKVAIRLYQGLLQRTPHDLDLKSNLGELLLDEPAQADRLEGARLLEEVLEADPDRLAINRRLVSFYSEISNAPKTREHMLRLIERRDREPAIYLELAASLQQEQQPERAAEILRKMLEVHPDDWRGHHRLARALFDSGALDDAEAELGAAATLAPVESEPALKPLRRDLELRRHELKIDQMRTELAQSGGNTLEQRFALIDELLAMGWTGKAIAECDALLEAQPELMPRVEQRIGEGVERLEKNYQLRDYLGDLYFRQERYDDLLQIYRDLADSSMHPSEVLIEGCSKILARVPGHVEARLELAAAYRLKEDWQGVIEALDVLLADPEGPLDPIDKALWVEAAYMLGRNEDAAQLGMQLIGPLAAETGFMLMMIELHQRAEDHVTAQTVFELAEAAKPQEPRLRSIRFQVLRQRRLQRLAQLEAKAAAEGLTGPEHYEKAGLHRDQEQIKPATIHYQRAADDPELRDIARAKMSICLIERGMFELAAETLDQIELTREALEAWPELKELIYSAARSMEKIKQNAEALKYFKRLFRADASYKDVVERLERLSN